MAMAGVKAQVTAQTQPQNPMSAPAPSQEVTVQEEPCLWTPLGLSIVKA